jgi:hypothetical protein
LQLLHATSDKKVSSEPLQIRSSCNFSTSNA